MAHQTLPPIPERVAHGARLLDTQQPGWAARINLDDLDEVNPSTCILAQLSDGDYLAGGQKLRRMVADLDEAACGFEVDPRQDADQDAAYAALTEAWHTQITTRRNGGDAR